MKLVKMPGLAAVATAALMAFAGAGTASATVLCTTAPISGVCPAGFAYTGEIHAVSEEKPKLTTSFKNIECEESTVRERSEAEGDATHTVGGLVEVLTFTGKCNCTVAVLQQGVWELHAIAGNTNGTLTSSGVEMTTQCSTIFGTMHCIYYTEHDDLGTLTSSGATGGTATIDTTVETRRLFTEEEENEINTALCEEEAIWHVKYKVTTPDTLYVANST